MPKIKHKPNILERIREKNRPLSRKRVMPKDKGIYLGSCNRSACLRPGANWYNHGSLAYYCANCAMELNYDSFNRRDAVENWGHLLCTEGEYDREKFERMHDLHNNHKRFLETTVPKGTLGDYIPDPGEYWVKTLKFMVVEDTPKTQAEIHVCFHDGTREMIPMRKTTLSNRGIRIN